MSPPRYSAPKANSVLPHTAYQVDYTAVNCGRIVPSSKRHICFKFGYTDVEALSNGKTGQDCRGAEHEIIITWSLSSGKQAIMYDQHEVFFDVGNSTQSKLAHTFKDKLGHSLQVKIHAASMSSKSNPDPDWKQYDIIIDGVSFFLMPKIFEIGIFPKENSAAWLKLAPKLAQYSPGASSNAPAVQFMNVSKDSILPPDEPKKPEPESAEVFDLLSFDDFDDVAPAVAATPMQTAPAQTNYAPAQAPDQTNYGFAQAPAQTNYAPAQQTYAPYSNLYDNSQAQDLGDSNCVSPDTSPGASGNNYLTPAQDPSPFYQNAAPPVVTSENPYNGASNAHAMQPNPATPPSYSTALVPAQPAPTSYGVDGAVKNLVNMDDFFGVAAATPATKESCDVTMQDVNAHKSLGQLQGSSTSNGKTPVMNPFNSAPAYQQQGMCNGYSAEQQPPQQQQYNNYGYQQSYAQPGFGHQ